jgi:predicted Zn-dependent peptidase
MIEKIRVNRRASIKDGENIHTLEVEAFVLPSDQEKAIEECNKLIEEMKKVIENESSWFGEKRQEPVKKQITEAQLNYIRYLMNYKESNRQIVTEFLNKNNKQLESLTSEEASKLIDSIKEAKQ